MTQHWFRLNIQRIDAARNMARFYEMSLEPDLFGGTALVRRWGRIGTSGQVCISLFGDERQAIGRFLSWLARSGHADIGRNPPLVFKVSAYRGGKPRHVYRSGH